MKAKSFSPTPFKAHNKLVKTYVKPFTDRVGNSADITYADYLDKHGKLIEGYVLFVKWFND